MWPGKSLSDEEHVERVRRRCALFHRLRPWFVTLYVALAVALVWILVKAGALVMGLFAPQNAAIPGLLGFGLGMILGALIGLIAVKIGHGLGMALFGDRTERLLLQYHDALQAGAICPSQDDEDRSRRRTTGRTRAAGG